MGDRAEDKSKHQRLRMLAMQLSGQLPDDPDDAFIVLKYMRELFETYLDQKVMMKPHIVLSEHDEIPSVGNQQNVLKFLREQIEGKTVEGSD
ncbi:hypothetical protein LJR231_001589 [Phyllobacterium sp. LjRoot231]|uniref:hypothetical protein n=1 Tax=Phyllobacterium sp. LjRoot231 TaxID=3342289 RepID=UPI003ECDBCE7